MKKLILNLFQRLGYQVSRYVPPDRDDAFATQQRLVQKPASELVIFDLGAFVGNIAKMYEELFPGSHIYCFEPFPDSFEQLTQNVAGHPNIHPVAKAVGKEPGSTHFQVNKYAPTNSILATHQQGATTWGKGLLETESIIEVEVTTLDAFMEASNIDYIDILKMDVQGAEYLVLEGAKKALSAGKVGLVYTEIILLPTYQEQQPIDETIAFMRKYGYELFNFYNQSMTPEGQLRQVDALFFKAT